MTKIIENKINGLGDNNFRRELKQVLRNFDCRLDHFEGYVSKEKGYSAYEIAVQNGFTGTEKEWLDSLQGKNGKNGKSVLELYQELPGNENATLEDLLIFLTGPKGEQGLPGKDGLPGDKGEQGIQGPIGSKGADGDKGDKGDPGKNGDKGDTGKSAYQIWLDEGNTGTEEDFLNSLKGSKGDKGDTGAPGKDGINGKDGKDGVNGKDAVLPNFKTINGETIEGTGNIEVGSDINVEDLAGSGLSVEDNKLTIGEEGKLFIPGLESRAPEGLNLKGVIPKTKSVTRLPYEDRDLEISSITIGDIMYKEGIRSSISLIDCEELQMQSTINLESAIDDGNEYKASIMQISPHSVQLAIGNFPDKNNPSTGNISDITLTDERIALNSKGVYVNNRQLVTSVNNIEAGIDGNIDLKLKTINGKSIEGEGNITIDTVLPDKLEKGKYEPAYLGGEYYGLDKNGILLSKYPKGSYPIRAIVELNSLGLKSQDQGEDSITRGFNLNDTRVSGARVSNNGENVMQFELSSDSFESKHKEGLRDEFVRFGYAAINMYKTDYVGTNKTDKAVNTLKFSFNEGIYVERDVKDINGKLVLNKKIGIDNEGIHFLDTEKFSVALKCKKNVLSFNETTIPKTVNGILPDVNGNIDLSESTLNSLQLVDQVTGELKTITIENGVLVVK